MDSPETKSKTESAPKDRFYHLPNQEPNTRSCEQDERDGERNLESLRRYKDKRDERDHPDDQSDEILGEEMGAFTEVVLHVGEACEKPSQRRYSGDAVPSAYLV